MWARSTFRGGADSPDSDLCDNDGTINVLDGGTLNNVGTLNNNDSITTFDGGALTNAGTLNNAGRLNNQQGGTIINNGGAVLRGEVVNEGTLINHGTWDGDINTYLGGEWRVTNYGTLIGELDVPSGRVTNFGTLNGFISTGDDAYIDNRPGGVMNVNLWIWPHNHLGNAGILNVLGDSRVNWMDNNSGGVMNILDSLTGFRMVNHVDSTLNNFGYLRSDYAVRNEGTLNNSGSIYLDETESRLHNSGTLNNSGSIQVGNYYVGGYVLHNEGAFNISTTGTIDDFGRGSFTQTAGSTINDGAVTQGTIDIDGGSIGGDGSWQALNAPLTLGPSTSLLPGNDEAPGTMTVLDDLLCDGCLIDIEVSGFSASAFDFLDVGGTAAFLDSANIAFDFIDGFAPITGDSFDFLSAATLEGLSNVTYDFMGLQPGFRFDVKEVVSGEEVVLNFTALNDGVSSRVPAPSPLGLLALGVPLLGWNYRWRQLGRQTPT